MSWSSTGLTGRQVGEDRGDAQRVARVLAGDCSEAGPEVGDPAGQDALDLHQLVGDGLVLRRDHGRGGHRPGGGLDRCDAAAVRRVAQRSAQIGAQAERAHTAGQSRCFTAARPACGAPRVPRVAGQAVQGRVGVDAQGEVRQIGTAERDRAARAQPLHRRGVDRGDRLGQGRDPLRGRGASHVDVLLDRERDAMQGAQPGTVCRQPVGLIGGREGLLGQTPDDRIDVRVDRLDPVQVSLDHLSAADLPAADHRRQFQRALTP